MNERDELIKRIASLLLSGFSKVQVKDKVLSRELTTRDVSEKDTDEYIEEAMEMLETDIGQDLKLQYPRLVNLYKLCIEKKDYTNAAKVWKEIQTFNSGKVDNNITIKFIK